MIKNPHAIALTAQSQTDSKSIPYWIEQVRAGETDIPNDVLTDFFRRLVVFASRHLNHPQVARIYDAEDAAQSALRSFCVGLRGQKFNRINENDAVWKTLITITKRKIIDRIQLETRQKRGSGQVISETLLGGDQNPGLDSMAGNELPPDLIVDIADEFDFRLGQLDDKLKRIALWRIEGYSNHEIANRQGCTERTIERKLALIRKTWHDKR